MSDLQNPFYVDNIFIQIISYLPSEEIIRLSILSRYHTNLVRNYHWENIIIVTKTNQLNSILANFNFKNIGLINKFENGLISIDLDLLSGDIRDKIKYSNITFKYDVNYLSLLKFLVRNAQKINVNTNPNKNEASPDDTQIVYKETHLTIHSEKFPTYIMYDDAIAKSLAKKYNGTKWYEQDMSLNGQDVNIPNFRFKRLIMRACDSNFLKYYPEPITIYFPDIIEQFYCLNPKKIQAIEQNALIISRVLRNYYDWMPIVEDNQIKWYTANVRVYSQKCLPNKYVWKNEYTKQYLDNICNYYGYDPLESMQYFYELSDNSFENFFTWINTSPLKNTCIYPFIFLNMYFAVKCIMPDKLDIYIMCCMDYGLLYDSHYVAQHIFTHILTCAISDHKTYMVEHALKKILNSNTLEHVTNKEVVQIVISLIWDYIVIHDDLNAYLSLQSFFRYDRTSSLAPYNRSLLVSSIPMISVFRLYGYTSLDMMTLIIDNIVNTPLEEWKKDLLECDQINSIGVILYYFFTKHDEQYLDIWIKFMKAFYGEGWSDIKKYISDNFVFTYQNKAEDILCWERNNLIVKTKKDLESQCKIIASHYDNFTAWSKYITVKSHNITPKILCNLFKKLPDTKKKINLLNFWYNPKRKIDSTYFVIIDYISSIGSNELLEWWKNKGLVFYYTRNAFDSACQNNHINTMTWWINNTSKKKYMRHSNNITQGGYFKKGIWKDFEKMTLSYSEAGLFVPNPVVYQTWKYNDFNVCSKNKIKKEIIKRFKPCPDKKLKLLSWLTDNK